MDVPDELAVRFASLFAGRGDAWGHVEGRSVKEPVSLELFRQHLYGEGSIGIYPLLDDGTVKWGCIDVDEGYDLIAIAINVRKALKALGITSFIERTKGKGFHVWTFYASWLPAVCVVNAQRVACEIAGYRPKEVNPKQTELQPGQLGNYVNLPYAKKWADGHKRAVIEADHPARYPLPLESFVAKAEASLNHRGPVVAAAALYKPPPPPRPIAISKPATDPSGRLSALTRKVYEEGPLPNPNTGHVDRSAGLQRLAHLCKKDGLTAGEAYFLVSDLDARLGKYVGRADADLQYQRIIERAYG